MKHSLTVEIAEDGTPYIAGERSEEVRAAIREISRDVRPTGKGLGMGYREFSTFDLKFILNQLSARQ